MNYSIGIDLGTTLTRTAILRDGTTGTVFHHGMDAMPPYVAFTPTTCLVSLRAQDEAEINPSNTIFDTLRFVEMKFDDPVIRGIRETYPFRVVDRHGYAAFRIEYAGKESTLTPMLILSMILHRCREDFQACVDQQYTCERTTITIPASFTFCQRQIICNAARIAQLDSVVCISSPIAACLEFITSFPSITERTILVIDCGSGFLDMAIASDKNGMISIRAASSSTLSRGCEITNTFITLLSEVKTYGHKFTATIILGGRSEESHVQMDLCDLLDMSLDWQNLSRSTTTADSGKTWVYAAPEVASYEKRNSTADIWSLGCVFLEMVTVLKGQTISSLRSFLDARSSNFRFHANIESLGHWIQELQVM